MEPERKKRGRKGMQGRESGCNNEGRESVEGEWGTNLGEIRSKTYRGGSSPEKRLFTKKKATADKRRRNSNQKCMGL